MDEKRARQLIDDERGRLREALRDEGDAVQDDVSSPEDLSDLDDAPGALTAEATDEALSESLRIRLAALDRAEQRLDAGTYGRSVRSGNVIPDERLEADPAAELTVEEAEQLGS